MERVRLTFPDDEVQAEEDEILGHGHPLDGRSVNDSRVQRDDARISLRRLSRCLGRMSVGLVAAAGGTHSSPCDTAGFESVQHKLVDYVVDARAIVKGEQRSRLRESALTCPNPACSTGTCSRAIL
jgi:hypothetical protein